MRRTLRRIYYGPPEWVVSKFDREDRQAFGFWVIIVAAVGAIFFGTKVLFVSVLSVIALIPNFTSETPVEHEDVENE